MRFQVIDADHGSVGLHPDIRAIPLASIDDENAFASESAIRFQCEAVWERIPIEMLEFFDGVDFRDERGDWQSTLREDALAEELVIRDAHPFFSIVGAHIQEIARIHPEELSAFCEKIEHKKSVNSKKSD